jgi:hypothetical protein
VCEPNTQIGSGTATVVYNTYTIPLDFAVYNVTGGLAVTIDDPNGPPVLVSPTWSGTTLTIPYPNGMYKGVPIVITQISLTLNQTGSGRNAFLRTPPTCPKSGWSSLATFAFSATGTSDRVTSAAKCVAPKKKSTSGKGKKHSKGTAKPKGKKK